MGGESLRVATWNIRYDNPDDGPNAWPLRRERVGALVRFLQPDVIGFQEALHGQVLDLADMLPGYRWVGVGRDDGKQTGEYSPVFYRADRVTLSDSGTVWLSQQPDSVGSVGWDAALPRVATWVSAEMAGGQYVILNAHFDHVGTEARRNSAALLVGLANDKSRAADGALVIGDFNAAPGSEPYAVLAAGLRDARTLGADHSGPDETYFGFSVAAAGDSTAFSGRSIDHIFVSEGTEVVRTAVLTSHRRGRFLSDHLPVVADVRLFAEK